MTSYIPPVTDTIDMVYTEDKQSSMLNYTSPIVRGVVAVTLIAVVVGSFMYLSRRTSPWLDNGDNIYFTKGNVGIGTGSPAAKLEVYDGADDYARIQGGTIKLKNGAGRASLVMQSEPTIAIIGTEGSQGLQLLTSSLPRLSITGTGNVGIGTNDPNSKLQVGAPTDQIYDPNPLNENVVSIFGPGCTPAIGGNADLNGTLFINSTDSYVPGTGASIAIGGRSTNFGGGEKHMTYGRISGIPGSGYRGNLVLETTNNGQVFERMRIDHNGRVGIGITDPAVPLHVASFVGTSHTLFMEYLKNGVTSDYNPGGTLTNQDVSIYGTNRIRTDSSFIITSDARIKKDIAEIDDGAALAKLRLIEPAEYSYVDSVRRGTTRVFGFIAQQVREHFPEATTIVKDFLPDVMAAYAVNIKYQTLQIPGKAKTGRLRLITKARQVDVEVTYVDSNTVSFPENTLTEEDVDDGKVFVYGYEVEDFHTLNKDYLFTINFAATQELDRQVVQLKSENQGLQTRLMASESEVSGLRSELQALRDILREKGVIE